MSIVTEIINFIIANPVGAGQIALSSALVLVTGVYTYHTVKQTEEMREDRKTRNKPLVKPTIENRYALHYFFAMLLQWIYAYAPVTDAEDELGLTACHYGEEFWVLQTSRVTPEPVSLQPVPGVKTC